MKEINVTDVMLGDWVLHERKNNKLEAVSAHCLKVANITKDSLCLRNGDYWRVQKVGLGVIKPIPLTAEILEKNGFEVQDQGGGRKDVWIGFGVDCEGDIEVEFQHNIPTHLKIDGVFKGEYYISTNIKYVHELQHALRLCGVEKEIIL